MSIKKQLSVKSKDLHHAYIIKGDPEIISKEIISFLEDRVVNVIGNPDLYIKIFETLSIDDSRTIKDLAQVKGTIGFERFFIIGSYFFTKEAENSLLKIFEEPPRGVHFFLITPNIHLMLPTLRSRAIILDERKIEIDQCHLENAKEFLNMKKGDRLSYIEKLIDSHKNDDKEDKETESLRMNALNLMNAIEYILAGQNKKDNKNLILEIHSTKSYIGDRGASIKMLLEHIAIII